MFWLYLVLYILITTHITLAAVTLYLHRAQAHRSLVFHPAVNHFFRFWLWLTTGMVTREWVAVHRRHHQRTDQPGDPHSPRIYGLSQVLCKGAWLYRRAAQDPRLVAELGLGSPTDWVERRVYSALPWLGIVVTLIIDLVLFGAWGLLVWAVQMLWTPFWAAGVINGIGHSWGYRNGATGDHSRNILPWGIIVCGEELHNNHHLDPANPRLSLRSWEFDLGWFYVRLFRMLGLVEIRSRGPGSTLG